MPFDFSLKTLFWKIEKKKKEQISSHFANSEHPEKLVYLNFFSEKSSQYLQPKYIKHTLAFSTWNESSIMADKVSVICTVWQGICPGGQMNRIRQDNLITE